MAASFFFSFLECCECGDFLDEEDENKSMVRTLAGDVDLMPVAAANRARSCVLSVVVR
jgi:hypothetical protein